VLSIADGVRRLLFDSAENTLGGFVELPELGLGERVDGELAHGRDVGRCRGHQVLVSGLRQDGVGVAAVCRVPPRA